MHTILSWSDKIPEKNGETFSINDIAIHPDGTLLVAAVGTRVLVYDAADGNLLHSLRGHKDIVYTVDFARDGKRFASGGADRTVIIWTSNGEGILKYGHNESIQKVCYNPISQVLTSCTAIDFGLWSPEQKSVVKHKIGAKVLCCSWNLDGQYLALGMINGSISIRDKQGNEKVSIERSSPIWTIAWNHSKLEPVELLAVGCWDQTLSFYQVNGKQQGKDRKLNYNPCCVSYYNDGKYLLIGGSNRIASIYNKEGVFLSKLCETVGWVWANVARPKHNCVAVGSNDGTISMYQVKFGTVHGIYQERYAYRENMTDVIVQHLMTEQKVRIKTRDHVKKLAVYRDRLAIQLSDRIIIYELTNENSYDMHYRVRDRIHKVLPCNLLVVTSNHFILCQEKKLIQYDFNGECVRDWVLDSFIRYIKVVGGGQGQEGLLIGLKNGSVYEIFLNNPFPILLIKQNQPVRCLDISANRKKLAIVDDTSSCIVYDLISKEMVFQESPANSVAWNSEFEDMLCIAGENQLKIKTGSFPPHYQRFKGFVVGFTGSKIFCLKHYIVQTIDIPQSAPLYRYVEKKEFQRAYEIACLGVTESDWRMLAIEAMKQMNFDIARKSFIRIRDMRYIELLNTLEHIQKQPNANTKLFMAEILAYQSRFNDAAQAFSRAGEISKGIQMFADLRMWEEAKAFANEDKSVNIQDLVTKQAAWAEEVHDWKAACEMYTASENYVKVARIMGKQGWYDDLVDLSTTLDTTQTKALLICAEYLKEEKRFRECRDIYLKTNEIEALMKMYIQLQEWDDAIALADKFPKGFSSDVFIPYAEWLALRDRFDEALQAYDKAGRPDQSIHLLKQLSKNSLKEQRYKDAAYYHWQLSNHILKMIQKPIDELTQEDQDQLRIAKIQRTHADLLYAYSFIFSYTDDPFTSSTPETLFNSSCYLLNSIGKKAPPKGISKARILFTLGKNGRTLGAFKIARYAYEKLQHYIIPEAWMDSVDLSLLTLQTQPFFDQEDLLPVDYRSSTTNPLINTTGTGDVCINSGHPFMRSFLTFENLPLVEFIPEDPITDEEAVKLIESSSTSRSIKSKSEGDEWKEKDYGDHQTLRLDDEPEMDSQDPNIDLFTQQMSRQEISVGTPYRPVHLNRTVLQSLHRTEIFILKYSTPSIRNKYYKNMIPEIKLKMCSQCHHFFHQDDYEFEVLKIGFCPVCRKTDEHYLQFSKD